MAYKDSDGRYILAAGEIGTYTVCPESWRLRVVEGIKVEKNDASQLGEILHQEWAHQNDEALFFIKGIKVLVTLTIIAVLVTGIIMNN